MAYDNSQLRLLVPALSNGGVQIWDYRTTDNAAAMNTAGYISDYADMGIRPGDIVFGRTFSDTTWATPQAVTMLIVLADGDLSDGTAIDPTDSD
jgi:hypothetical protein